MISHICLISGMADRHPAAEAAASAGAIGVPSVLFLPDQGVLQPG